MTTKRLLNPADVNTLFELYVKAKPNQPKLPLNFLRDPVFVGELLVFHFARITLLICSSTHSTDHGPYRKSCLRNGASNTRICWPFCRPRTTQW